MQVRQTFSWWKIGLAGLAVLLVALFFVLDLQAYLTLDFLKGSRDHFVSLYQDYPIGVLGAYLAIYILVTALSLPGAAILTLAGGALFGFWRGLVVVSFASSIGATLACFAARFVLRDWVQSRFGDRLAVINRGMEAEGPFYLFSLRLIPVFPFFVINLVMGLSRMPLLTFYWISQLGMLPGTAVYVNAGRELGRIDSLAGILSPRLLFSFVLLGLFPLAAKKMVARLRRKKR